MPAESHILPFHYAIAIDNDGLLPPAGATHGQVIALAVYVEPVDPLDPHRIPKAHYPVPEGKRATHVVLNVIWAGHPSVGRGGKAWEG